MRKKTKIIVIGPGAIGLLLAAHLKKSGNDVCLMDYKKERAAMIEEQGVDVEDTQGPWHVFPRATVEKSILRNSDYVFVCVKCPKVRQVARDLSQHLSPEATIITVQNGIGYWKAFEESIPQNPLVLCSTSQGATKTGPLKVFHAGKGPTFVGTLGEDSITRGRCEEVAQILNEAGWDTSIREDILPIIWTKLMINCAINPITALTRKKNGELLEYSCIQELQHAIIKEVQEVAERVGITLGISTKEALDLTREVCERTARNTSSMLQDVLKKRETEIDYINGAVVSLAKSHGLHVPFNQMMTCLVRILAGE